MKKIIYFGLFALLATGCAKKVEPLTFWAMGQEGERVGKILEPFLAAHPEIHLKLQSIPWGAAHDKLLTAYAGRSTPDVCQLGNTWVSEFNAMKALSPLDARVKGSKTVKEKDYFPGIWNSNVLDGKLYGIPWYVDTRALFYRKDLFLRAGFDHPPRDWKELAAVAKALTHVEKEKKSFGISLPANPSGSTIPLFFAWQNRADLLDPSETKADVQTASFKESVDYYVDFFREGSSPREVGGLTNFYQAFASGYFAMFISGPWEVKGLRDKVPSLSGKWGVAPLPPKKVGGSRASLAGGSSLVILKDARHPEQAWALIEYLSRPEVQAEFYQATTDLPARISAWKDPRLAKDAEILAFYHQLQQSRPTPKLPEWEQLADKLGIWVEKAIYGKVSTSEAMAGLSRDLDQVLEKRRWLRARQK